MGKLGLYLATALAFLNFALPSGSEAYTPPNNPNPLIIPLPPIEGSLYLCDNSECRKIVTEDETVFEICEFPLKFSCQKTECDTIEKQINVYPTYIDYEKAVGECVNDFEERMNERLEKVFCTD